MKSHSLQSSISVNLEKISKVVNASLPALTGFFLLLGYYVSFFFHFATVTFFLLTGVNFVYRHVQKKHALLTNFGLVAQLRYMLESVGPEFRQYLFISDTEEKPFNRTQRNEIYRKSKGIDSSLAFGSLLNFDKTEVKLRHSMYPLSKKDLIPYNLSLGEERNLKEPYILTKPILIGAMSYGALGKNAIRALARGAGKSGIPMNTGEGGYPKYHLMENCDLIYQIGTAKFGVRNDDSSLNEDLLQKIASKEQIKMMEIKISQGAKPGKGGLLPKEKITEEIAELRNVPMGEDILSPTFHIECTDSKSTVKFIKRVQEVSGLPTGIKFCFGREDEFYALVKEMKRQDTFPDYLSLDGSEGGTGAAPKTFMDDIGLPVFAALPKVINILKQEDVLDRLKIFCSGKMISPGKQFMAFSQGADAIYTARGFLLALGCIQALQCHKNICPVGITTHNEDLQRGLDIEDKSLRVVNYVKNMLHEHEELLASLGQRSVHELSSKHLFHEDF